MIRVDIKGDINDVVRKIGDAPRKMEPSIVSALNRTMSQVNTRFRRDISSHLGIPQKHIKGRLKQIKATYSRLYATLIALTAGIPYIRLKRSAWNHIDGAFVQTMPKSGHKGVFKRRGKPRLPIDEQRLEIEPVADRTIRRIMASFAPEQFRQRLEHEIRRRLK